MNYFEESLKLHQKMKGKLEVASRIPKFDKDMLSLAYTPGVAQPCLEIQKDINKSFELTRRWNTVAVVTDGTAILGLGDIGPEAGMPVLEGKAILFKKFGNIDAIPLCIRSKDPDEIVRTIELLAGTFGGINLEDISAPRCFEIEKRLKEKCEIPVFHDDQHGTAIAVGAALINSLKLANKKIDEIRVVINGAGSAGIAIAKYILKLGVKDLIVCDKFGIIDEGMQELNEAQREISLKTNRSHKKGDLADALKNSDVFIGVSVGNIVSKNMIESMAEKAIAFTLANPTPEIPRDEAIEAGAYIVGTGRSDLPNQINNLLVFPGVFRGALDVRSKSINDEMLLAAGYAIANSISEDDLNENNIIPSALDERVHKKVSDAVAKAAVESKAAKINE
ncbi:NAD(P)-dependent malic enzyme [Sporosalibacterium faouarense]|uniref:NAD(P)-dependent malic enzyme n=1 Tax=Sporosalibacterium faouarense TaxID=516123 RepID=UPI00141D350C|nr:NADP-dependent malic enzyme [Sporosalibacterium faouarense]MTI47169.1 NADP-dependent malic enzyme [Bacillota bacterium]